MGRTEHQLGEAAKSDLNLARMKCLTLCTKHCAKVTQYDATLKVHGDHVSCEFGERDYIESGKWDTICSQRSSLIKLSTAGCIRKSINDGTALGQRLYSAEQCRASKVHQGRCSLAAKNPGTEHSLPFSSPSSSSSSSCYRC